MSWKETHCRNSGCKRYGFDGPGHSFLLTLGLVDMKRLGSCAARAKQSVGRELERDLDTAVHAVEVAVIARESGVSIDLAADIAPELAGNTGYHFAVGLIGGV